MQLEELAHRAHIQILHPARHRGVPVEQVYSSNRMSDLLEHSSATTVLVTSLATSQLLRVAELMDVPAVCIASSGELPDQFVRSARRASSAILHAPWNIDETCRRIRDILEDGAGGAP